MPAVPYATSAELQAWVGAGTNAEQARLGLALAAATLRVDKWCGRTFATVTVPTARLFYAPSSRYVAVDDFSTTTGLAVMVDTNGDGTYETAINAADYAAAPINKTSGGEPWPYNQLQMNQYATAWFPSGTGWPGVQVTALWGWASVPEPVKQATLMLAADVWSSKNVQLGNGGYPAFVAKGLGNGYAQTLLAGYRLGRELAGIG